ncbi:MAG: carboxypeptidase-like regulatory domain-containing protein [Candidatus Bathyarchaeota archaeon]
MKIPVSVIGGIIVAVVVAVAAVTFYGPGTQTEEESERFAETGSVRTVKQTESGEQIITGDLMVHVYDLEEEVPINGATVTISGSVSGTGVTAPHEEAWFGYSFGYYNFEEIPTGWYTVTATKEGYTTMTKDSEVWAGEIHHFIVLLVKD